MSFEGQIFDMYEVQEKLYKSISFSEINNEEENVVILVYVIIIRKILCLKC